MTNDEWVKNFDQLLTDYGDAREDRDPYSSSKWRQAIKRHISARPEPQAAAGDVLVMLKRPEGYEDVHPELVLEDAHINPAFEPEIVSEPKAAVSEERIYELAKQHLGGKGHDLIWQDDPIYAAHCDMPKDARWSKTNVSAEETLAFASAVLAASRQVPVGWQPISTAPKDGRTLLLGYLNSNGKWRTLRGQWFSAGVIEEAWEDTECAEGWYETSVECEDDVNCWATEPTHWMPLPALPVGEPRQEEGERSGGVDLPVGGKTE